MPVLRDVVAQHEHDDKRDRPGDRSRRGDELIVALQRRRCLSVWPGHTCQASKPLSCVADVGERCTLYYLSRRFCKGQVQIVRPDREP